MSVVFDLFILFDMFVLFAQNMLCSQVLSHSAAQSSYTKEIVTRVD